MTEKTFDVELVGFCGFYDTALGDYLDNGLNYDLEHLHDSLSKLKVNEFNCWYDLDYKQYMKDVADLAMDRFIELGNENLEDVIALVPTGKVAEVSSPREYNFTTDRIFKQVKITEQDYYKLVGFLSGKKELAKQVFENHFTSYDGFTSFYSNKLDYWLHLDWETLTDLQFSYIYHCALCVRLFENDYYRHDNNGDDMNDIMNVYSYAIRELENNVYDDFDTPYTDYVNWGQYQKELRHALDKENVEDTDDVANNTLWDLTEYAINSKNQLVKRNEKDVW